MTDVKPCRADTVQLGDLLHRHDGKVLGVIDVKTVDDEVTVYLANGAELSTAGSTLLRIERRSRVIEYSVKRVSKSDGGHVWFVEPGQGKRIA